MQRQSQDRDIFDKVIELYNFKPNLMAYHMSNYILFRFLFRKYLIKNPIEEDKNIFVLKILKQKIMTIMAKLITRKSVLMKLINKIIIGNIIII